MGIDKAKPLVCESIYWQGMNNDIKNYIQLLYMSWFSANTAEGKIIHYEIPGKAWEVVGAEMFTLHNKNYFVM